MPIKHLVLGVGSWNGLNILGALFRLKKKQFFQLDQIKSIYATSAGAIVAIILLLNLEENVIFDYIVHRPWHKIVQITPNMVMDMLDKKGLIDITLIKKIFLTLFATKDMEHTITLLEFYKKTNVELVICATKASDMSLVLFSHISTPHLQLLDALYMSCTVPIVFQPRFFQDDYIIDGGIIIKNPIKICIENGAKPDEILDIKLKREPHVLSQKNLNIFLYSFKLFDNLSKKCNVLHNETKVKHTLVIPIQRQPGNNVVAALTSNTKRRELIDDGQRSADLFMKNHAIP